MGNSPIFVVGCPRSGTTLLRDLLRSHPRLSIPQESHCIPRFYMAHGDPRTDREAVRLARAILNFAYVRVWKLGLAPDEFADCRSYAAVVERIFSAYARREGKARWGDKTPQNVQQLHTLWRLFPDCRIVHIYRDGRDVARSWLNTSFGPRNYHAAACGWQALVRGGRTAGAALPAGTYLEVRYETLLEQPRQTLEQVCAFVGEVFHEAMLKPAPLAAGDSPVPFRGGRRPRASEILTSNHAKWKTALTLAERAIIESAAGGLLQELGYQTEGLARPVPAWQAAGYRLHNLTWMMASRLTTIHHLNWLHSGWQLAWAGLRSSWRGRVG